jgi:predicted NUDIX family NTP pyrophosphohydrolase
MYRLRDGALEVLLGHPGGPYWTRKDIGAWTLPKGEYDHTEQPLDAALREFNEETGFTATPPFLPLGELRMKSGKRITAWAFEGDADPARLECNSFEIEWPPRSGLMRSFPEIDRAQWFGLDEARRRLLPGQAGFIDRLLAALAPAQSPSSPLLPPSPPGREPG